MKNLLLAVNLFVLLLMGCKKEVPVVPVVPVLSSDNALLTFQFASANNTEEISNDINCIIYDTLVAGISGTINSRSTLVANFTSLATLISVNGIAQVSGVTKNDFTKPVVYTVTAQNGIERKYTVKLQAFTGLPIIFIDTDGPVESKDLYVNGTMKIDGNMNFTDGLYDGKIEIRGRGNSTWEQLKKPYKLKLDKKSVILGMPADKEWALLANYFDKTLMRNDVAFEFSERLDMAWTPRRRFVEVFLNGEYNGNYLLTETVKTGKDRLNISVMDTDSPADTTGGFLVEANSRMDAVQNWITPSLIKLSMDEPDVLSPVQFDYVQRQFLDFENNISAGTDMRTQLDIDGWIKWVIVNEVMRNRDAILYASCYFYKDNTQRISMGPVWDFDQSSGSYGGNDPEGWYVNTANWINGLMYHPYYKQRFKEIWSENYNAILDLKKYIKDRGQSLQYSQKENFLKWDVMNTGLFYEQIVSGGYQNEVDHFSDFLDKRISWMNTQISQW